LITFYLKGYQLDQERSVPAEVLELPAKGDRIIHFAWEPHVRLLLYMSC